MKLNSRQALTLIELLVAVAIIGILAAIATPSLLEAGARARVSAAKANLRVLDGALAAYMVDYNRLPPTRSIPVSDPAGIFAEQQLTSLTTPVAYATSTDSFLDPFGEAEQQTLYEALVAAAVAGRHDEFPLPGGGPPNPNKSLLYFHYPSFSARSNMPAMSIPGAAALSLGPDRKDSFGAFSPFPGQGLPPLAWSAGYLSTLDTLYDPTNGTFSAGDIVRLAGEAAGRAPTGW
jgi:prepilin-type N-terminal cleavage/methylation domain-containing protein